jgi:hypothetical protein
MTAVPRAMLVALVDLSTHAITDGGVGRAAALDRAHYFIDTLLDGLAACAAAGQLPWEFDVAAVGCRHKEGVPDVVPLLPEAARAAAPLSKLLAVERPTRGEGEPRRWLADKSPEGDPALDAGWNEVSRLLTRWLAEVPNARPPVVVRCVFGIDGPESAAERGVRAFGRPDLPVAVFTYRIPDDVEDAVKGELPVAEVWDLLFADQPPRSDISEPTPEAAPFEVVNSFHCEKLGNDPAQWEDAYVADPESGRAAIADGAGEGIFCRAWADLLSAGVVADAPDVTQLTAWVARKRTDWIKRIDYPNLNWSKQAKADSTGAAATLLGLKVGPLTTTGGRVWRALAVGDACLFWVRDGQLRLSFPLACGEQLGSAPDLLRTLPSRREPLPLTAGGVCLPGDLFFLATDAVAGHLFRLAESGQPVGKYAELSAADWKQEATDLRRAGGMVNDDCTLLVLRVTGMRSNEPAVASVGEKEPEAVNEIEPLTAATDTNPDNANSGE